MPNYDYICSDCKYTEERFGTFSQMPKETDCPKCFKKSFIRCIGSGQGIIFKGTGFYENDVKKFRPDIKDAKAMKKIREEKREAGED